MLTETSECFGMDGEGDESVMSSDLDARSWKTLIRIVANMLMRIRG